MLFASPCRPSSISAKEAIPLRERASFRSLSRLAQLPPATGKIADKDFFDNLSGGGCNDLLRMPPRSSPLLPENRMQTLT